MSPSDLAYFPLYPWELGLTFFGNASREHIQDFEHAVSHVPVLATPVNANFIDASRSTFPKRALEKVYLVRCSLQCIRSSVVSSIITSSCSAAASRTLPHPFIMNMSKPSQCIFCTVSRYVTRAPPARRKLHASAVQLQRQPPRSNAKARMEKGYKPAEMEKLRELYSPEQMAAIEAGEKVISGAQLGDTSQRVDPWSPDYVDDLSQVDPFLDKPVRAPWSSADETPRMKTEAEIDDELAQVLMDMPAQENSNDQVWETYLNNMRVTVGGDSEGQGRSAAAPEAPDKIKKKNLKQKEVQGEASPALVRLMQMTGYSLREISALRVKSIISHAVVNQTRLGKIRKTYYLSVAGNGNGRIGIGEGKSEEGGEAMLQSQYRAIRNMQPILRYEKRTIFGEVDGKVSATELELYARPPGMLRPQQHGISGWLVANTDSRIWSSMPAIHLGGVQMRRHLRSRSQSHPSQKPHEHRQSDR